MTPCKLTRLLIAREVSAASLVDAERRGDTRAVKRLREAVRCATLAVMAEERQRAGGEEERRASPLPQ